jgi:membrane fusion protein, multidrug efflux system
VQVRTLVLTGVTAAKQEVQLRSEASGLITGIHCNLGDYVRRGKVLIQIDDRLKSFALDMAKLNASKLEDEFKKNQNLYAGHAATEIQLRDARINYESAKIAVSQAQKQLSDTRICAPQNGYLVYKAVEPGSFVDVGATVATLVDISKLKVLLNVAEGDAYTLKVGQTAVIASTVFPGVRYNGKVSFISQQSDKSHTYHVELVMDNPPSAPLKAGTFVTVAFSFRSHAPVLLIPREALLGSVKDAAVYVARDGVANMRSITVGMDYGEAFEVVSGLAEGEQVVTTGQINLASGSQISIHQ